MYPFYRHTDTHPQTIPNPRDHNVYPYPPPFHYYPSWDSMPPQMKADSSTPPSAFGPWPYNTTNISHGNSSEGNGCCNHAFPHGYYSFRPPHPQHFQPPPPPFYYGPYPPYPEPYPAYFVPPPPYSTDRPCYDYDTANHCCGCPNHSCHKKDNIGVKIEEHNPETEQKSSDSSSVIRAPNNPYPIYLSPSGHVKASELQPGYWNGWFPMDVNSLRNVMQQKDEQRGRQSEDKKTQLPLPLIRLPGYKQEEPAKDMKDINVSPKAAEDLSSKYKLIPLKLFDNKSRDEKPGVAEDGSVKRVDSEVGEKERRIRTIPVKQKEESDEKKVDVAEKENKKDEDKKVSHYEKKEENALKKPPHSQQQSEAKSSKLPPVCLRVDPLPRRKNGNGTSQSPSLPCHKDKEKEKAQENKVRGPTVKEVKDEAPRKKQIKVITVQDKADQDSVPVIFMNDKSSKAGPEEAGLDDGNHKAKEASNDKNTSDNSVVEDQRNKEKTEALATENKEVVKERRSLSQSEAAIHIQSAYRGYEVRRWKPLDKLRKVAHIRDQVNDIRKQVQNLQSCSELQDTKQRTILGETIMNLLLQLDTIQGLHPSVREIRKSVAKQLVCLQEQVDSLGSRVTKQHEVEKVEELQGDKIPDDQAFSGVSQAAAEQTSLEDSVQLGDVNEGPHQVYLKETEKEKKGDEEIIQEEGSTIEKRVSEEMAREESSLLETLPQEAAEPLVEKEMVSSGPMIEDGASSDAASNIVNEQAKDSEEHNIRSESLSHGEDTQEETMKLLCTDSVLESSKEEPAELDNIEDQQVDAEVIHPDSGQLQDTKIDSETEDLVVPEENRSALEEVSMVGAEEHGPKEEPAFMSEPASAVREAIDISLGHQEPDSEIKTVVQDNKESQAEQLELKMLPLVHADMDKTQDSSTGNSDHASCTPSDVIGTAVAEIGDDKKVTGALNEATLEEVEAPKEDQGSEAPDRVSEEGPVKEIDLNLEFSSQKTVNEDDAVPSVGLVVADHLSTELSINEGADISSMKTDADQHIESIAPEGEQIPIKSVKTDEQKLLEENEKLRKMLERLLEAGKEQLGAICNLNGRVKDLEKKLSQKKKVRVRRKKPAGSSPC